MRHITAKELSAHLQNTATAPLLLDVREPWEYQICHIAGARLLPLKQIPNEYGSLNPQQEIVLICHHGSRSARAAAFLEQKGFSDVVNLTGGMDAWASEVDTTMAKY